jgi:hypothetical protein
LHPICGTEPGRHRIGKEFEGALMAVIVESDEKKRRQFQGCVIVDSFGSVLVVAAVSIARDPTEGLLEN